MKTMVTTSKDTLIRDVHKDEKHVLDLCFDLNL